MKCRSFPFGEGDGGWGSKEDEVKETKLKSKIKYLLKKMQDGAK